MARVSDNNITTSINLSMNRAKSALEDLQIRGASLKKITRPSDDPLASVEALNLGSVNRDNNQYLRNTNFSLIQLNITESTLDQLTDIVLQAKEIAINQASDIYDPQVRKNVSNQVVQLRKEALALANKRIGPKYIFAGHKILQRPFNRSGEYFGDTGKIQVEVAKDFFVPINLNGYEVFFKSDDTSDRIEHPLKQFGQLYQKDQTKKVDNDNDKVEENAETIKGNGSGTIVKKFEKHNNLFSQLKMLVIALENNDTNAIQNLLDKFDDTLNRLVTLRTRIGSITKSIMNSQNLIKDETINNSTRKSYLIDADIASLFSSIEKQQQVLKTTYQSGQRLMNQNLIDFLR